MSSIFSDGVLHPGRDANDSVWLTLRRPEDWAAAVQSNVLVDPTRPALLLQPGPLALPSACAELRAPDGTRYRADPCGDQVLRWAPCDAGWQRWVGGRGTEAGKLRRPLGLALDAKRGLIAIADADNRRVQIVRADTGEVVVILGCNDGSLTPPAGDDSGALLEPVAVSFYGGALAVADGAGGAVQLYDAHFRWLRAFRPVPARAPGGFVPAPVAVALSAESVWVIDAQWSLPVAYDRCGHAQEHPGDAPDELSPWLACARYAAQGTLVLGPIDGRTEELAWHRVVVDAAIPEGAAIEVQTFASDDPTSPTAIAWAPAAPVRMPLAEVETNDGTCARLVVSDQGRWARKRGGPYLRSARPLAVLAGTGPVNAAGFGVPWSAARRLRVLDTISLGTSSSVTPALPIVAVAARAIHAAVRGDRASYGAGSHLTLLERDGAEPLGGPRLLATFAATDGLDLSAALADDTLYDLDASHAVAALLRDGDVLLLDDGASARATVVVSTVDLADATVVLGAAVAGDFSNASLRLVATTDRLVVDQLDWRDDVPAGELITVYDDDADSSVIASLRAVERDTGTLWLEPGVIVPWATWTRFDVAEPIATDRGRYLWLRLRLLGAVAHAGDAWASATPIVRAVRLLMPRLSYARYLPAVYDRRDDDDPSGALFLERMLALPEAQLTAIEASYESVARMLNPRAASPDWLRFVAGWYGLAFDPSWPIDRRRELVVNAHALFAMRGTVAGMRRYLEIYLGRAPTIVEGFQWRTPQAQHLGAAEVLGSAVLGVRQAAASSAQAHHFSVWVFADGGVCSSELTDKAARAIIESIKPAHTTYDLQVVDDNPRVGLASVGIDMVLLGTTPPSPLGARGLAPSVLGQTSLPAARHPAQRLGPIPLDHDLTLT